MSVNGVLRGGGYKSPSNEFRDGGRRYPNYMKSQSADSLGFRTVNGVMRAVRINVSNNVSQARCSNRYGGQGHNWVSSGVGFRLNGVWRGCSYSAPVTFRARSGFRWGDNNKHSVVNVVVGFRSGEWCIKGREIWARVNEV